MTDLASEPPDSPAASPGLTLVATPIGNLGDLSPRALAALRGADAVLCEDTRVTGALLARHGISATLLPLHEHNEDDQIPRVLERLRAGQRLALASDAGTPLVSDPGYRLVRAVIAAGLPLGAIPGPSAAVMALTLSGLPPHPFLFAGFLPARAGPRAAELARLRAAERAGLSATLVFYESPHRLGEALAAMAGALGGDRPAAVARELTKRFEEVRRASLAELAAHYAAAEARGEVVVVVGPAPEERTGEAELDRRLGEALAAGMSLRDAAAAVAAATGLPRRQVYARALEIGREPG
ncbi:16S rRNA (cytidine(1402)-2'-O)-methyltransferase [Crenalkalicoccus roseus]|uniref:16S rRNA (cytidine(1402)-2'-O)-methyltransferase n=1 Tax=Crenalkalicoccus roseus TaxID=1485588 RepID=UPI001080AC63|nr:16S rRNA (cytidine(1402)-2'-O)-methyltransferase [Crenalkalicoccus roseus]